MASSISLAGGFVHHSFEKATDEFFFIFVIFLKFVALTNFFYLKDKNKNFPTKKVFGNNTQNSKKMLKSYVKINYNI